MRRSSILLLTPTALRIAAAALTLQLGACATSDDPREGGFISGAAGLMSGKYDERIAARENEYERELARQDRADAEYASLERELTMSRARLGALKKEISAQRVRASTDRTQQEKLLEAQRRTESVSKEIRRTEGQTLSLEELRQQSMAISRELEEIDGLVEAIYGG